MHSQPAASDRDSRQPRLHDRLLLFDLGPCHYALRASAVNGLAECGPLRQVPGAPPSVLGLVEWRGHPLTVLDLPRLLGHSAPSGPPCLIRLAPPLQGTSLFLPAHVRMATLGSPTDAPAPADEPGFAEAVEHDGRRIRLIDPSTLLLRAEKELEEGRRA